MVLRATFYVLFLIFLIIRVLRVIRVLLVLIFDHVQWYLLQNHGTLTESTLIMFSGTCHRTMVLRLPPNVFHTPNGCFLLGVFLSSYLPQFSSCLLFLSPLVFSSCLLFLPSCVQEKAFKDSLSATLNKHVNVAGYTGHDGRPICVGDLSGESPLSQYQY